MPTVIDSPASKPQRCAIYTRKSTTQGLEQDFNTLDAQTEACRHYIQSQTHLGWKEVPESFSDGGFSGANTNRPAFSRLLSNVIAGSIDVVIVYKVDRLSRSLLDFSKIMEIFNEHEVAFVSITQNFSTATALGRLTLNILMSFSEFEREMISERTRDKIEASRQKGKWTGGLAPLGYEIIDHKLHVVAREVGTVQDIFRWSVEGHTATWIAGRLNDLGIQHKSLVESRPRPWDRSHIANILQNRVYAGQLGCQGGEFSKGEHESIITTELFELTQVMLSPKARKYRNLSLNPAYIARGVLVCSSCERPMSTSCHWYGTRQIRYYRCATLASDGKSACPCPNQRADTIETYLVKALAEKLRTDLIGIEIEREQLKHLRNETQIVHGYLAKLVSDDDPDRVILERKLVVLARIRVHLRWFSRTVKQFDGSWPTLTLAEQNLFLRTIVRKAVFFGTNEKIELAFRDFRQALYIPDELGG